ncbi:oxidized purine nucleoside triphosphate hydrolase-like [Xenia sp. Carnegie-2017]|uniref:oxidized purine nucleoside triphosphate hydrolase-like n=1 Tax=Xenia sp. Carnegie-2017 TaxID=2897299 RepID=UPI001F037197|nr:oxidized purine nucleoside triphosphate hydrolase-like [Xenia sp. Carnegie-2017]
MTNNKLLTLVFVFNGGKILLGMKKRGFGAGRWNGFGGKVDSTETIEAGAKRELKEECNLTTRDLKHVGILKFEFVNEPQIMEVHIFTTKVYEGEVQESEEMRPKWFNMDEIPFNEMWPDDKLWFPLMLSNNMFKGYFKFEGHDKILHYTLTDQIMD